MVWNAQNSVFASNVPAHIALDAAANVPAHIALAAAPNVAANVAAQAAPNVAANVSSYVMPAMPAGGAPMVTVVQATNTGAGGASGTGFLGGYGPVARYEYATPAALAPIPWMMDFAEGDGWPSFPYALRINPYAGETPVEWRASDWDPGLRFWSLKFDPQLTEWLQDLNLAAPSVMAAREFANGSDYWLAGDKRSPMQVAFEGAGDLLTWRAQEGATQRERDDAFTVINGELDELVDLMRDDRMRYLEELSLQSGQIVPYFVHLMGMNPATKPWTMELMNCASSLGNLVKMQYKSHYRRVRASFLCPGLTPPWGPPQHPSFPSGHSTVAHLTALLLLSVKGIAQRFGIYETDNNRTVANVGRAPRIGDMLSEAYGVDQRSPLLWMAWRIAKGRERLGVHYPSDSAAGRRLAFLVWEQCVFDDNIPVPALKTVLARAQAEWP